MGLNYNSAVCFLSIIVFCNAKLIPIIYEDFEICTAEGENAGKFDFSQLEILAESDTSVSLNGSWIFAKEVKSPWTAIIFAEKYIRSQWNVEMLYKKIPDFCDVIQGENEPWYYVTQHFEHKNCPFPAGTEIKFDMQSLTDNPMNFPDDMAGNWRLTFVGEFDDEGGKKECVRMKLDLVEE